MMGRTPYDHTRHGRGTGRTACQGFDRSSAAIATASSGVTRKTIPSSRRTCCVHRGQLDNASVSLKRDSRAPVRLLGHTTSSSTSEAAHVEG
jgi:hypothetical protein